MSAPHSDDSDTLVRRVPTAADDHPRDRRGTPTRTDLRPLLLAASISCTLVWIVWGARWTGAANVAVLCAALGLHAALWFTPRRAAPWSMRHALVLVGILLAVVAVVPLHHSRDLYLYDIYGQAVVEHRVSPYTTAPDQLGDPNLDMVADKWHEQTSMYGPAFVAVAAVVSRVGGESELLIRLSWQAVMAVAAMGAVVLVARRTRDPMAVVALGCSPVLLATVNDAHNDVLIGLGILAVVLLVDDRRYALAGAIASLVIATKVPAAVPIGAIGVWVAWRRGWRPAAWFGVPLLVAVCTAYLAVGGTEALTPLRENAGDDSRFAIWQPLRDRHFEQMIEDGFRWRVTLDTVRDQMATYALVLLVVALLVVLWRYRRAGHPGEVAGIAGCVLMVTSTYVMPWYPAMVLPVVALSWGSRTSRLVQVQAAFLLVAYAAGPGNDPTTGIGRWLEQRAVWIDVALLVAAVAWAAPSVLAGRRRARVDSVTSACLPTSAG